MLGRRFGGVGIRRGVRNNRFGGRFTYPDSTIIIYDGVDPAARTVTSAPDVDALINQITPGTFDVSQSTAADKPHEVLTSPAHVSFDATDYLEVAGLSPPALASGDFSTAFVIANLIDNGATAPVILSMDEATTTINWFIAWIKSSNVIRTRVETSEGVMVADAAFTPDGSQHLFGLIHTGTDLVAAIDGVRGTPTSLANTGLLRKMEEIGLGAHAGGGNTSEMNFRKGVVMRNPTSAEVDAVEAQLLSEVP